MGSHWDTPGVSVGEGTTWSDLPKAEVLAELDRILESHQFRASKKCSRFFRHIVEAAVEGRFDCLKERTLGVDVFEREPNYDTNQDPVVRGTAGEVRKRLAQYYLEAGARELRFSLPPGSYIPEAHHHPIEPSKPPVVPAAIVASEKRSRSVIAIPAFIVLAVIAAGLWLWPRPTSLDRFWDPALSANSVLVCMGQPQLYTFRADVARGLNAWFAEENHSSPPPVASVAPEEIRPMWSNAVALADAQAFSRLANLFAQKRKQVDLRGERLISLSDLRGKPAVFIGAFDNEWTLSFGNELRFYFDTDHQTHAQIIRDKQNPAAVDWQLVNAWPPGKDISKDYALVTRMVNRTTEQTIVILAGIAQYGTEAAAEFVTDPAYFEQALAHAPRDWYRKNIQVVISTRVLSGVSGPPTVVAAYFW